MNKSRYRFSHRAGNLYYWYKVGPISGRDSRHEQIVCSVSWFWGK